MSRLVSSILLIFLFTTSWVSEEAAAQPLNPKFGLGFNAMVSSADGFGIGFRGRASAPVSADLSLAADLGFTGFVLNGRRNADYIFDPQVSAIVTLPTSQEQLTYLLFGFGGYVPVGGDDGDQVSGPTIHLGIGRVVVLRESSFYYEINPALVIGEERVDVAVPLRAGVIF